MTTRHYKNWLQAYCEFTKFSEAPPLAHVWTGVSTLAGALRRKIWFDMGHFEWTPNFYIIIVGPPGVITKSTTANIGMDLLKQLGTIHFGPSVVTWQALVTSLAKNAESFQIGADNHVMSAITCVASEMGTFVDPRNREMIDVLVDLWDGKRGVWEKMTKSSGDDLVENPWINLLMCTTPSWLGENMPETMIGGGFTSRCVFIYGDSKVQYVAYPKRNWSAEHEAMKDKLVADLEKISMLSGPITLTEEAYEYGEHLYNHFWQNQSDVHYAHLQDPRFQGYASRRQTHLHKLAFIMSASQDDSLTITKQHLVDADELLTVTERTSMPFVFRDIGKVPSARILDRLVHLVVKHKRIPRSDVFKDLMRIAEPRMVQEIINGAIASGLITLAQYGSTIYIEQVNKNEQDTNPEAQAL